MVRDVVIAVHESVDFIGRLKHNLPDTITVLEEKKVKRLMQVIRLKPVSCILMYMEYNIPDEIYFERFKKQFPGIPCIAILVHRNMELARHCGSMGIESVLSFDEIERISDEILKVRALKSSRVGMTEIGIIKESVNYSVMLRDVLSVMEQNYVTIFSSNEIADLMEITEATLSREFAKYDLPGPKRILMYLKVHHAIRLMHNQGLNIREISSLSGFTNEKRMAECFHRMFQMSPGEYRLKNINIKK
jgi:AraC-like DNA-binding protein